MPPARDPSTTLASALLALTISGCGDDVAPEPIERADLVHAYRATTFTTTDGTTTDQLARGAELALELDADGSTSGRLFVPGGAEEGGDLDADLEGTWTFDDQRERVEFEQEADTFVRDMGFTAVRAGGGVELRGEETFSDTTIAVVLSHPVFQAFGRVPLAGAAPGRDVPIPRAPSREHPSVDVQGEAVEAYAEAAPPQEAATVPGRAPGEGVAARAGAVVEELPARP